MTSLHNGTTLRQKLNGDIPFKGEWRDNSTPPPFIQAITWLQEYLFNHCQCSPDNYLEADGSGTIARCGGDIHEVFASDHLVLKPDNHNFNLFPFRVKEVHNNDKINYYCTSGMTEVESNAWRSKVAANHKRHTKERWELYKKNSIQVHVDTIIVMLEKTLNKLIILSDMH